MSDRPGTPARRRAAMWAAATAFWLFVAAMFAAQILWIAETRGQRVDLTRALAWQTAYFVAWIPFTIAVWQITRGWLPERFGGWLRLLLAHVPVSTGIAVGHAFAVTILTQALAPSPMSIRESFLTQLRGDVNAHLLIYAAIAGTGAAITLYEQSQERHLAAARLQAELAAARLEVLRGHLQPHFLFNSLHAIAGLARVGDTAGVVRLIAALSDVLRYVLDAGDGHAPLRAEIQIVERYLDIQRARFPDRLAITIDIAPEVVDARVPLLIVQPLVENAVRHGLGPRVRQGSLIIRAVRENARTRIDVEDTGVGLAPGWSLQNTTGTGLRNLASRLAAEFGDAAGLHVAARDGGGVRATVTLPYVAA